MKSTIRALTALMLASAFCFSLTACNTMEGAGEDIEAAGEEIQEEADENS